MQSSGSMPFSRMQNPGSLLSLPYLHSISVYYYEISLPQIIHHQDLPNITNEYYPWRMMMPYISKYSSEGKDRSSQGRSTCYYARNTWPQRYIFIEGIQQILSAPLALRMKEFKHYGRLHKRSRYHLQGGDETVQAPQYSSVPMRSSIKVSFSKQLADLDSTVNNVYTRFF